MVSENVLRECREYVAANEASAREYLNRYFVITEYTLSKLGATMLSEFAYMAVEDVEKIPGISYSDKTWWSPVVSTQSPETVIPLKWLKVPDHLRNLKCYILSPRMFIITPPDRPLKELSEGLKTEEYEMSILPVFHFSSFISLMHRRFPLTEKTIEEYERNKNLKELRSLVSSS